MKYKMMHTFYTQEREVEKKKRFSSEKKTNKKNGKRNSKALGF